MSQKWRSLSRSTLGVSMCLAQGRLKPRTAVTFNKSAVEFFVDTGYMRVFKTDNGPPFKSVAFPKWCKDSGIKHRRISPYWPQANGMAERFMQPLAKAIRVNSKFLPHYNQEVKEFTRTYNATPQSSTGFTPRELLY
jgi:transposase InsO family protein